MAGGALEETVGRLLRDNHWTVAVAESCTGGLVSSRLTDVEGASDFVTLNVVTYSANEKISVLGVTQETVDRYTVTSAECAMEMLAGLRSLTKADFCLSLTGLAGPGGGTPSKPVGLVYIGLHTPRRGGQVFRVEEPPGLTREELKRAFSQRALELLRLALCEVTPPVTVVTGSRL
jgi:nicotinamide-nucleotide amidase